MRCFTSEISFEHIRHVDTSHLSIIMVIYISCKGRWLGFKVLFIKIFICDTLFRLFTTSKIITAAITVVPFCFQSQPWGGFTSTNFFFFSLSVASSKALRDVLSFNEIWNVHRKVFFKNSCSEYFPEIPRKTSATELMFNIVVSFQYALCYKWFSRNFPKIFRTSLSKNTAGEVLLILSDYALKVSGTPFNPLTLCG